MKENVLLAIAWYQSDSCKRGWDWLSSAISVKPTWFCNMCRTNTSYEKHQQILTYTWTCPLHCFWRRRWCHSWGKIMSVIKWRNKNQIQSKTKLLRSHSKVFRSCEDGRRPSSVGTAWEIICLRQVDDQ